MSLSGLILIVEGEDDKFSYEVLFERITPELNIKTCLLNGCNKENLKKIFPIQKKKIEGSQYSGFNKGLIICDCDKKCAPEVANFIKNTLNITDALNDKIKIHATCKELETLFLICIEDISEINGKKISFKKIRNPENIPNPKEYLEKLLYKEDITYGREVAREMAKQVDIRKLKEKSQNFWRLYRIVNDFAL